MQQQLAQIQQEHGLMRFPTTEFLPTDVRRHYKLGQVRAPVRMPDLRSCNIVINGCAGHRQGLIWYRQTWGGQGHWEQGAHLSLARGVQPRPDFPRGTGGNQSDPP